jgi:hypothetical protein
VLSVAVWLTMLGVIMCPKPIMLSVVLLSVIVLNVVAPLLRCHDGFNMTDNKILATLFSFSLDSHFE